MAIEDRARGEVVIRIAYDGPALAGKTTSLRSLSEMLARSRRSDVYSPSEVDGRTLYFDWLDYLGGWLDGKQVRCQIISLPGQRALATRRALLLRGADVVILVFDSTHEGVEAARGCYQEVQRQLAGATDLAVPVVFQANKQDLPGALAPDVLREALSDAGVFSIVPSNATSGAGVREAFTFAVRIALDRVRELTRQGKLCQGEAEITSGEDLLTWLESAEQAGGAPGVEVALSGAGRGPGRSRPDPLQPDPLQPDGGEARPARLERRDEARSASAPPLPPTSRVPSGLVWPPMTGRMVLHELETTGLAVVPTERGDFRNAADPRWAIWSAAAACYEDLEVGRRSLLEAARLHARLGSLLSEQRAVALAETGSGKWRLWKVSRLDRSLRAGLDAFMEDPSGAALLSLAAALIDAQHALQSSPVPLPVSLANVGRWRGRVFYTGIVPDAGEPTDPLDATALLYREFGLQLQDLAERLNHRVPQLLKELREHTVANAAWTPLVDTLTLMLIGE